MATQKPYGIIKLATYNRAQEPSNKSFYRWSQVLLHIISHDDSDSEMVISRDYLRNSASDIVQNPLDYEAELYNVRTNVDFDSNGRMLRWHHNML